VPRVLKIVVVPHNCMTLQGLRYYEPSFVAYATFVFYKEVEVLVHYLVQHCF
jgi:hypothetical protein